MQKTCKERGGREGGEREEGEGVGDDNVDDEYNSEDEDCSKNYEIRAREMT